MSIPPEATGSGEPATSIERSAIGVLVLIVETMLLVSSFGVRLTL